MFEEESERQRKLNDLMDSLNTSGNWEQPDRSVWEEYLKQPQGSRFRSELLNRVDEIVFNLLVGDQLSIFARLSMTDGPHQLVHHRLEPQFQISLFIGDSFNKASCSD
ncbi:hypothetical protein REPUB_Repub14bG0134100 [Reevesia pubescens]